MIAFFGILIFGVIVLGGAAAMIYNADKNSRSRRADDSPAPRIASR